MKARISVWRETWDWYNAFFLIVASFFVYSADNSKIIYGLPRSEVLGIINVVSFSKWAIMMALPIVLNITYLNKLQTVMVFIQLRLRKSYYYSLLQIYGCALNALLWSVILLVISGIKTSASFSMLIVPVIVGNQFLWATVCILIFNAVKAPSISGPVVIGLISFVYFLGEYYPKIERFIPTSWGMVCRSSLFTAAGISIIFMILCNWLFSLLGVSFILITHRQRGDKYASCSC